MFLRYRLAATFCAIGLAFAQTDRGIINGTVTDSTSAQVPEARVVATNTATGVAFATKTTNSGVFSIPTLPVGLYRLRVERQGFKAAVRDGVTVSAGGTVTINAQLEVGAVTESVNVEATVELLQTSTAKVSTAVSNKMVDELPLVVGGGMRGAFDLALITPEANQPSDGTFNVGGGQGSAFGATLDGVTVLTGSANNVGWTNVNTPSVDAITEFAVETNGFKAEYGRGQGGMITFSSKSGTNNLHGTAYEFLRNDALDARRFFEDRRGKYKQHDFGWSVGGPVWIPKIYDGRNKTFFFASGEWFRNRVGAGSGRFSIPTPEMFNGDFRNWVDGNGRFLPIYDPATTTPSGSGFTRQPFAGNQIPQSRFPTLSRNYVGLVRDILKPNNGAAPGTSDYVRNNFINSVGTALDPWTKFSAKGDHSFGLNDRVSFLFNSGLHERLPGAEGFPGLPYPLAGDLTLNDSSSVIRGSYDKVITPTIVNHLFGGFNVFRNKNTAQTFNGGWEAKGICLKGAWNCDRNLLIADFSDYNRWGTRSYDGSESFALSVGNDLSITKGKHTFKLGYLWERIHYNGFGQATIGGQVTGDRRSTSVPNDNNLSTGGGNGFASFLLGQGYTGGTENERFLGQQWRSHAWYFQDDYKLSNKLTLNYGVRYEFTLPPLEQTDKWSDLDLTLPNARAGNLPGALRFAGFGPGRENKRTLTPGWYGGISPRFGLAYGLDSKTVLRASAGRSFGVAKTITGSAHFEGAFLIFSASSLDNGVTPAFQFDQGLPPYTKPPVIDPTFTNGGTPAYWDGEAIRLPENYQWSLSVQRQVSSSTVVEVNYHATIGAHLVAGLKRYNQLPLGLLERYGRTLLSSGIDSPAAQAAGLRRPYQDINCQFSTTCAPVSVAQALRPYPQFRDINTAGGQGDKSGHASYHALLVKIDKRYEHGSTLQGSYVFSKLITDADAYNPDNGTLDHYNRRLEKSIGEYDLTHNFKFTYIYELPFGKNRKWLTTGPVSWALGNWQIAGSQFYSSGYPLPLANNAALGSFLFNGRSAATVNTYDGWIVNKDNPDWKGSDRFFQAASFFGPQPTDRLGNSTRHNPKARQPVNLNENLSLAKKFLITESVRMDLRWEMFNAFNRFRPSTGSTNVQDPTFGQVLGQFNEPRRMQLGLKLYW